MLNSGPLRTSWSGGVRTRCFYSISFNHHLGSCDELADYPMAMRTSRQRILITLVCDHDVLSRRSDPHLPALQQCLVLLVSMVGVILPEHSRGVHVSCPYRYHGVPRTARSLRMGWSQRNAVLVKIRCPRNAGGGQFWLCGQFGGKCGTASWQPCSVRFSASKLPRSWSAFQPDSSGQHESGHESALSSALPIGHEG